MVQISGWELHNVVRDKEGLRVRLGFVSLYFAPSTIVKTFTVESPSTTEPWHYIWLQGADGSLICTVRTEEFVELFQYSMGVVAKDPAISMAVLNNQIVFNSPSFSAPVFGFVGGGLQTMTKVASINEDTTALDVPVGHVCAFGDRLVIAQGHILYFSDPGIDPRTFVGQNAVALTGSVYDLFVGPEGSLYAFTSAGLYTLPSDALGGGQIVVGYFSRNPNIVTSTPGNAAPTPLGVVVVTSDGVGVVSGGGVQALTVPSYGGRRRLSRAVEVDDWRPFGRVHSTPDGAVVGFVNKGFYLDLSNGSPSWVYTRDERCCLRGVLQDRDGGWMAAFATWVGVAMVTGGVDEDGYPVRGVVAGRLDASVDGSALLRRVTVSAAQPGQVIGVACSPAQDVAGLSPVGKGDIVVGSTSWSGIVRYQGARAVSTRCTLNVRSTEPAIEVLVEGAGRRIVPEIDVELGGVGRNRRDKQQ